MIKALIKSKTIIATDTLQVEFDLQGQKFEYLPGQYCFITLIDPPHTDMRGAIRHFSIIHNPAVPGTIAIATRLTGSAYKESLRDLPVGSAVEIGEVMGDFVLPAETAKSLVFIAGGIGITPFVSMLRQIQSDGLDYIVTLIYANRNQASAAFLVELQEMTKVNPNIKLLSIMSDDPSWSGDKGMVDAAFIKNKLPDYLSQDYYVAGPPAMVAGIAKLLAEVGVDKDSIKTENFVGYK